MSRAPQGKSLQPTLALALGGGGARGLAHIVVLEALDELGVRPAAIAGTSIGAIIGAAYAAGMSGRAIREHVLAETRDRASVLAKLFQARVGKLADLFSRIPGNPMLIDAERFLDRFWPKAVPDRFDQLAIPFAAIAADFHAHREVVIDSGPLVTAVAASMAVPGLVRPVEADGRVLVDGGVVDPLPFEHLAGRADIVVAVDVIGGPDENDRRVPDPFEAMFAASQLMMQAIVAAKLAGRRPDILVRPAVNRFRLLDFFRAREVLAAAEPVREEVRRALVMAGLVPGPVPATSSRKG